MSRTLKMCNCVLSGSVLSGRKATVFCKPTKECSVCNQYLSSTSFVRPYSNGRHAAPLATTPSASLGSISLGYAEGGDRT
jgi:hypothetical protein